MNITRQTSYKQAASLETIEIWESLLSSCADPIDAAILQLARAGYDRKETAGLLRIGAATVYRRLKNILGRYRQIEKEIA